MNNQYYDTVYMVFGWYLASTPPLPKKDLLVSAGSVFFPASEAGNFPEEGGKSRFFWGVSGEMPGGSLNLGIIVFDVFCRVLDGKS